ncbi:MAG: YegS/Rv2252/BmrU family lipid kinase [Bacteroidales bacterium]|nr:YegS/Rv2252/BmrU family lipid kinase [Bacteroidales bacterium]
MSGKIKILFIVNPISGIGRQKKIEQLIEKNLDTQKFDYQISYTQYAGHATKIAEESVNNFDVITAVGGDGSINEIAKTLAGTETALAIIPCGSGNGLARALGIPVLPNLAIKYLNKAEFKMIDTCEVNKQFFLSLAGAGYDSEVARRYQFLEGRGFKTYFKAIVGSFFNYNPLEYTLNIDGKEIKRTALLITVCNSSQYGYGFKISPEAELDDGLLDVVIVKKPQLWRVPFVMINIALGQAHKSKCFEIIRCRKVELLGNKKGWINLDGEALRLDKSLDFVVKEHNIVLFCQPPLFPNPNELVKKLLEKQKAQLKKVVAAAKKTLPLFLCFFFMLLSCKTPQPLSLVPGKARLSDEYKSVIDSIVSDAIFQRAMPGCRIYCSVNHYTVFDESYGYFTYDSIKKVNDSTFYDLASVTKIAASALVLMKLYEDKKIDLDLPLTDYFHGLDSNGATLKDALAHQAGFRPALDWVGKNKNLAAEVLASPENYDIQKARKQLAEFIVNQPLKPKGEYLYSDLGFFLYTSFPKKFYGKDFDVFLYDTFYRPMGLKMRFNPYGKLLQNIPPTENDTLWRKKIVCGQVHDEGAVLMGGISGHAGLFSGARDLAVLLQMLLDKGSYDGKKYFEPETVEMFTSQAFEGNRRGLVFDKPVIDSTLNGTPSKMASPKSFGHTGFTGAFVWADPKYNMVFVFLCNSTFPDRSRMLMKLDVRTKIHDEFYKAMENGGIVFD